MAGSAGERDRPAAGGVSRLYRGADEGGSAGRRRSPATLAYGDDRASRGRQDQCAERTLCRKPRTARRLLLDRGTRSRCGAVLGGALPGREPRRDRGTTDLGNVSWDAAHLMLREGHRDARDAAEATARQSYGKLIAFLAHRLGDVAAAEDALAEAFAAALVEWPARGVPDNPEAWLLTVARRKAIDAARRRKSGAEAAGHPRLLAEELTSPAASEAEIPDHRLALIFACAHPAIDPAARAPLILQTMLGFDAATIGSAFLVAPATMGQRLVRAKAKIRQAGIPFRVPERAEMAERVEAVLEAIYAAYAEGWSDPAGTEARLRNLADEAIWLGHLVASLLPEEPEALGLLALMLFAEARRAARRNTAGEYVPLADQDSGLWDGRLIEEAEAALYRASWLGRVGRYQLEAAVQSAHVVRRRTGSSDWAAI